MAEFIGTAVIFTIAGILIGLAWNYGGPVRISEPKDYEERDAELKDIERRLRRQR